MERHKKARKPLRMALTRTINEIGVEMANQEPDLELLNVKLLKLDDVMEAVSDLDQRVLDGMLDVDCSEEDYLAESLNIEDYKDRFRETKSKVKRLMTPAESRSPSPTASQVSTTNSDGSKTKTYKLPKIKIKEFDGDIKGWLGFWSQFEKIHEDQDLHDSDKFQYLSQAMVDGSRAQKLVSSYPQTADNYGKVINALKSRFGDPVLLAELYVRELLKFVNTGKVREGSLASTFDELESHLRSLESLGVKAEQSALFLYPMIESSLPVELIKIWQRSPLSGYGEGEGDTKAEERLSRLMKFLRQEVKGEERLSLVKEDGQKSKAKVQGKKKFCSEEEIPSVAGLFIGDEKKFGNCIFCGKSHQSKDCWTAKKMSIQEKESIIKEKSCCFVCLKFGHFGRSCKANVSCSGCGQKHFEVMCREIPKKKSQDSNKKETVPSVSAANLACSAGVTLGTLNAMVRGHGMRRIRILVDNGSQKSHIKKSLAQELGLRQVGQEKVSYNLFGGSQTEVKEHKLYQIDLLDKRGVVKLKVTAQDQERVCAEIPRLSNGPWMGILKKKRIWIDDIGQGSPEIELLIGADAMADLLTGKMVKLGNGLIATESVLGWFLIGKSPYGSVSGDASLAMSVTSMHITDSTIDNCVTSVQTVEEFKKFKEEATKILAEAKMDLRLWQCNSVEESGVGSLTGECGLDYDGNSCQLASVLGLKWNLVEDTLSCELESYEKPTIVTKRSILSTMMKVFDPIGFLAPMLLLPKLLVQEAWLQKTGWDDEVPTETWVKFEKWFGELKCLSDISIPRNFTGRVKSRENWQLHTFCDASKDSYAAVVFLRTSEDGKVTLSLLQAKSRVSPTNGKLTIPRLELMACLIGARLADSVKVALSIDSSVPNYFWSDSSTALAWIKRNDQWGTFVGNRVRDVLALTSAEDWKFVPGIENPADLPSRGCSPSQLLESRWWEGPEWLRKSENCWPDWKSEVNEDEVAMEMKKSTTVATLTAVQGNPWYILSSSYHKNIRIVAWVRRFVSKARGEKRSETNLTVKEIEDAEELILKMVQKEVLPVKENIIQGVRVISDANGLMRVKTKLLYRKDSVDFRYPIVLPNAHPLVEQLIEEFHVSNGHGGVQLLMGLLRERYWILSGRQAIKKIVKRCVTCRRFNTKRSEVIEASLPENRVKSSRVFEVVGVDLAGPLHVKKKKKSWIVLFTCAVYRCVHLELVKSMSTETFLDAFSRFCSRRGRPSIVYSDNGTNFVGADNAWKTIDWEKVTKECGMKRIQWIFNPPSAPWWGGWWERLIRSTKDMLRRTLGRACLSFEKLGNCLCEIEAFINQRPLTTVTEDPDDLRPLTPAMFMHELTCYDLTDQDLLDASGFQRMAGERKKIMDELKMRFRREYLAQLVQRRKENGTAHFKIGDIVLVEADNKKRWEWPMARIVELLPGRDGIVRTARVKTKNGFLVRAVQRLYNLEVESPNEILSKPMKSGATEVVQKTKKEEVCPEVQELKTKSGRVVKQRKHWSYE